MGKSTSNAAVVEKARRLYEGREAIYCEHGVLRVHLNKVYIHSHTVNITKDILESMAFDLEEIPTQGFPVWIKGREPSLGPHPLRWMVGTNFQTHLYPQFLVSLYGGWQMYFAPALVAEVVEMATEFTGDNSRELIDKIRGYVLLKARMKAGRG